MKRKFFSFLLCICFLLSGCNETTGETETSTETAPPAETTTADTTPVETTSLPQADENLSLAEIPFAKIENTFLTFKGSYLTEYFAPVGKWLGSYGVSYFNLPDSGTEGLKASNALFTRDSTRKIALTDEEKKVFTSKVSASEYIPFDQAVEKSAYSWYEKMNTVLMIENLKTAAEPSNLTADVVNAQCSYRIGNYFSTNAFVAQDENGKIRFIIDPAYLIGIPVIAKNPEHLTFDLNGIEVMMDSFPVTTDYSAESFPEVFENRGTDFFYARIRTGNLSVNYDFETGYHCTASVSSVEPLTDDIESALNKAIVMNDPGKDPVMTETYNAIVNNLESIYKDSTHGITLLDLDFDGTPELLVSDVFERDTDNDWEKLAVNVSIYRIENGGLKYIDTFQNAHTVVYDVWNSLGLKILPDGTKAWFSTSPDNEDFLYQLKGDQWIATEVFTRKNPREITSENGYTSTEYDYYFLGEKIEPTVIHEDISEENPMSDTHLEWNGIFSYWGEMWELIGFIRQDYCSDIKESYSLYSDWLSPYAASDTYEVLDRYPMTERELSYNIAYLVDCFYLGNYNPASRTYSYRFLGDYAKPVIYLYPEEKTEVSVRVDFSEGGGLTCTYPEYGEGWEVTALPDGTIYDKEGNEYYCLYWEGSGSAEFEYGKGWCVAGSDTAAFLREKLLGIGLTARESNEFIIYWLPALQKNPYNLITFHTGDYAKSVPLTVSPIPDTVIRVFMTYEPVDAFTEIEPQALPHYEREGFTLVEWGGSPSGEALLQ